MSIIYNNKHIGKIQFEDIPIKEVYKGDTLIWSNYANITIKFPNNFSYYPSMAWQRGNGPLTTISIGNTGITTLRLPLNAFIGFPRSSYSTGLYLGGYLNAVCLKNIYNKSNYYIVDSETNDPPVGNTLGWKISVRDIMANGNVLDFTEYLKNAGEFVSTDRYNKHYYQLQISTIPRLLNHYLIYNSKKVIDYSTSLEGVGTVSIYDSSNQKVIPREEEGKNISFTVNNCVLKSIYGSTTYYIKQQENNIGIPETAHNRLTWTTKPEQKLVLNALISPDLYHSSGDADYRKRSRVIFSRYIKGDLCYLCLHNGEPRWVYDSKMATPFILGNDGSLKFTWYYSYVPVTGYMGPLNQITGDTSATPYGLFNYGDIIENTNSKYKWSSTGKDSYGSFTPFTDTTYRETPIHYLSFQAAENKEGQDLIFDNNLSDGRIFITTGVVNDA